MSFLTKPMLTRYLTKYGVASDVKIRRNLGYLTFSPPLSLDVENQMFNQVHSLGPCLFRVGLNDGQTVVDVPTRASTNASTSKNAKKNTTSTSSNNVKKKSSNRRNRRNAKPKGEQEGKKQEGGTNTQTRPKRTNNGRRKKIPSQQANTKASTTAKTPSTSTMPHSTTTKPPSTSSKPPKPRAANKKPSGF